MCAAEQRAGDREAEAPAPRVYVDGVFDLFHPGHLAFLRRAREVGGHRAVLVVGVVTDEDARWKRQPIMSHSERLAMVRGCAGVDVVVEKPPLVLTEAFLAEHRIDRVVHGDDDRQEDFFRVPIQLGIMVYVPYEAGISTTSIIERVVAQWQGS